MSRGAAVFLFGLAAGLGACVAGDADYLAARCRDAGFSAGTAGYDTCVRSEAAILAAGRRDTQRAGSP